MIAWKLGAVLKEMRLTDTQAAALCGVTRQFINRLVNHPPKRFDSDTLSMLCGGLDKQPGDLMEYVSDQPAKKTRRTK